jgi:hypothetical protein
MADLLRIDCIPIAGGIQAEWEMQNAQCRMMNAESEKRGFDLKQPQKRMPFG